MNRVWFIIGVACRLFLVAFFLLVIGVCFLPYYLSRPLEFVNLPGEQARLRMAGWWPESIAPKDVEKVSARIYSQIDSYVGWYQIVTSAETAEQWQELLHAKLENPLERGQGFELVEGVHRTLIEPVVLTSPSHADDRVTRPAWWTPLTNEFQVTERMRWYRSSESGYGDAVYSTFDQETKTLWVYAQSRQHHQLWEEGKVPPGNQFGQRFPQGGTPIVEPKQETANEGTKSVINDKPIPAASSDVNQ